jgi:hypothetical protein
VANTFELVASMKESGSGPQATILPFGDTAPKLPGKDSYEVNLVTICDIILNSKSKERTSWSK